MSYNFVDITNKKFGRLLVLEKLNIRKNGEVVWHCKCDCGSFYNVRGSSLRYGNTTSCGCFLKERAYEVHSFGKYIASLNSLYNKYKRNAINRDFSFSLSIEQFKELTKQNCHYCKIEPRQTYKNRRYTGDYIYNGIDRVDNTKGYYIENCVPCCKVCNIAKHEMSKDEFKDWLERIYANRDNW